MTKCSIKSLYVFDIDDTLFRTSAADQQIIVAVESYLKHNIQGVNCG